MPESDDPLKRTEPRVRWLRAIARREFWCVLMPTARGPRWFPAGVPGAADTWLLREAVTDMWTSVRTTEAVIGRPYPMKLTAVGVARLREWWPPDL